MFYIIWNSRFRMWCNFIRNTYLSLPRGKDQGLYSSTILKNVPSPFLQNFLNSRVAKLLFWINHLVRPIRSNVTSKFRKFWGIRLRYSEEWLVNTDPGFKIWTDMINYQVTFHQMGLNTHFFQVFLCIEMYDRSRFLFCVLGMIIVISYYFVTTVVSASMHAFSYFFTPVQTYFFSFQATCYSSHMCKRPKNDWK